MDTTAIDQIIAEAQAVFAAVVPVVEGWADFAALDLTPEAAAVVTTQQATLNHLLALERIVIEQSVILKDAIRELLAAGHPAIPTVVVSGAVAAELDDQIRTQQAARATALVLAPTTQVIGVISDERPSPPR